ncbi:VLRF1 family aeRF1-type release factor [Rubrobacter naiadicus]|uniref:VLRF1 family aeRF1-type release factor n=1 Tax=Rubrobacter naiadicus TaxID=1392641 RepID=UPI00235E052B|nr:VLRF1 family aeRF1-type release factor [Rubrobacter naiadicus]
MSGVDDLRDLKERVAGRRPPLLSVYLNVNPGNPENRNRAYVIRLKDALREEGVPKGFAGEVVGYVEELRPRMRTLVLFSSPEGWREVRWIGVELPEEVFWGEPYVAPLDLAVDEYAPVGVVVVDAKRVRLLVSSLGSLEEELKEANVFDTAGWREITLSPSSASPQGGMAHDLFERRVEEWVRRFYKRAAGEVGDHVKSLGLRRLILAGPEERTAEFVAELPREAKDLVAARIHLPQDVSEGELARRISETEEEIERSEESELLRELRERGVRGLEETLRALDEGRIYRVAVPWPLPDEISWCDSCGVALAAGHERCPYCGGPVRTRRLANALSGLAASRGASVEFVRGENARALREELGGIAGLPRF